MKQRYVTFHDNGYTEVAPVISASKPEYANLLPSGPLQVIQDVLEYGAEHGHRRFERGELTVDECINHALAHLPEISDERKRFDVVETEDHLAHAATRLIMALAIRDGHVDTEYMLMGAGPVVPTPLNDR